MVQVKVEREGLEEFRRRVVEAKVRQVLGLQAGEDLGRAGRRVTEQEMAEQVAALKAQIHRLKQGRDEASMEKEVKEVNMQHDQVIADMRAMVVEFKEKANLARDCANLRAMTAMVAEDVEGLEGRARVVRGDLAAAEASTAKLAAEMEAMRVKHDEVGLHRTCTCTCTCTCTTRRGGICPPGPTPGRGRKSSSLSRAGNLAIEGGGTWR